MSVPVLRGGCIFCVTFPALDFSYLFRTYRLFKQTYDVEKYCLLILPPCHRSAFCKFRCGVAPTRIETARNENMAEEDVNAHFAKLL